MEAEIVALASCCCELFPIIDLVYLIGESVGLTREGAVNMHVSIYEDNAGALVLANFKPPQYTPQSEHYAIKTNWSREQIITHGIEVVKI